MGAIGRTIAKAIVFACILLTYSCTSQSAEDELKSFFNDDNALTQSDESSGIRVKVTYLPLRYFELLQIRALPVEKRSEEAIAKIKEDVESQYQNGVYFLLNLSTVDEDVDVLHGTTRHFGEWSQQLQKLMFQMSEFITLETAQDDDIKLSIYDFQRSFGYTKDRSMLLVFPTSFNDKDIISPSSKFIRMHIQDFGMRTGRFKLEWDVDDLY